MKSALPSACLLAALAAPALAATTPIPSSFASTGADRAAIESLLSTYTRAVSTKDQAAFEALLLSKDIPFSGVYGAPTAETRNYEGFRKGVFEGAPFTQTFRDVDIRQDGALADVTLVFVNTDAKGSGWGLKTLQLLKVAGRWKIASEFYTGHG